jgi:DNA polymerase I-like protein with 3'-5' exonuclease and polymerase domains
VLQGALFPPESDWRPPRGSDLPTDWNAFARVSVDTETCDPKLRLLGPGVRRGAYVVGISFAVDDGRSWYLPLRHLGGDNVENPALALGYVRHQARRFRGEVVGAKLSYDLDFLAEENIHFPLATFRDVQVAEPIIDELQYSYSLDACLGRHGLPLKDEAVLREAALQYGVDPKGEMWKLPARYVGRYAEVDALRPLALLDRQLRIIEERRLGRVWDLECAVLPVLVKMRRRGVRVDFDHLDRVERWSRAEEMRAWGTVARLTGVSIRVGDAMKPEPLARALAEVGIKCGKTAKGKPSVTKEFLEEVRHPVGDAIRRARKMSQVRTTFIAATRDHAVNGRIHATFNQTVVQKDEDLDGAGTEGARPGRLSCVDPNLQNQPGDKDPELGPFWRATYLPDEGAEWASADYSQQEPRGAVHFALASGPHRIVGGKRVGISLRAYEMALEAARRYETDRNTDAHDLFTRMVYGDAVVDGWDKVTYKTNRSHMKNIFLGVCYGMGGPKLCRKLGYPTKVIEQRRTGRMIEVAGDEGQALLDLVDRRAPYLRETAEAVETAAKGRGYIITAGGRHCHFERDAAGNYEWTHKAFNNAIQGTAADQAKTAMVVLDRAGFDLQLQVHDEFSWSEFDRRRGREAAEIMENCMPQLRVPSKVDVEFGSSWGDSMLPPGEPRWWLNAATSPRLDGSGTE